MRFFVYGLLVISFGCSGADVAQEEMFGSMGGDMAGSDCGANPCDACEPGCEMLGECVDGLWACDCDCSMANVDPMAADVDASAGAESCGDLAQLEYASERVVVINELVSKNEAGLLDEMEETEDWIELFNPSGTDVDLSGWRLGDDLATCEEPWAFPQGTVIAAGDFLIIWADKDEEQGPLHASIKLSSAGEVLSLIDDDGKISDEVSFPALDSGTGYARTVDGGGEWVTTDTLTPGMSNEQ